jgi:HEAT repeat protein
MLGWLFDALGWSRFAVLGRQAQSPETAQRVQAATGFAELPEPRVVAILVGMLGDVEPSVRVAAGETLKKFGPLAVGLLLEGLKGPHEQAAVCSAELLGEMQSAEAVEPLLRGLKYATRPVQLAARKALERLGPAAVPALEAARGEPQPWVKRQIEDALETIARGNT